MNSRTLLFKIVHSFSETEVTEAFAIENEFVRLVEEKQFSSALKKLNENKINVTSNFLLRLIRKNQFSDRWNIFLKWIIDENKCPDMILLTQNSFKFLLDEYSDIACKWIYLFFLSRNVRAYHDTIDLITKECDFGDVLMNALKLIEDEKFYEYAVKDIILKCIEKYNAFLLQTLKKLPTFDEIIKKLNCDKHLLEKLLTVENAELFSNILAQYVNGVGHIDALGAKVICAQTARRKQFEFKPTLIFDVKQFDDYLDWLALLPGTLRERVLYEGVHWAVFDIYRDERGKMSVLVIDSVGVHGAYFFDFTKALCIKFFNKFSNIDMYGNEEKKLHAKRGCSIISADDIVRLHTVERYLPEQYQSHPAPLHAYLKDSADQLDLTVDLNDVYSGKDPANHKQKYVLRVVNLPLPLLRNMQSRELLNEVIPKRSSELGIFSRKRHRSPIDAVRKNFLIEDNIPVQNHRSDKKLRSFAVHGADYLLGFREGFNDKQYKEEIKQFTFKTKKRKWEEAQANIANAAMSDPPKKKLRVV